MIRSTRGGLAAASLCLVLTACGGGGSDPGGPPPPTPPTALPSTVSIESTARAETGSDLSFATTLTTTDGVTFAWDFGDGTKGSDAAPKHAYAKTGTYRVTVAVANSANERRDASFGVTVGHFSNVSGLACSNGAGSGWCWQNTNVTGHMIRDMAFVAGTMQAWAVG